MSISTSPAHCAFYRSGTYCAESSVGYLLKRGAVLIKSEVDRRVVSLGLTDAQWGPLVRLRSAGPCTVAELARWLFIDAGAMTRLLDRLEKKNLCRRVRSTADRRVVLVELTDEGQAAVTTIPAVLADVMNAHLVGFSTDEWQTLMQLLQRLVDTGEALRESAG